MKSIRLPSYNVNLVDYFDIFRMRTDKHIINDLHKHNLLKDNISLFNKTVKAVVMHHVIKDVCDYVLESKKAGKLLIMFNTQLPNLELTDYINELRLIDFMEKLIKRFSKLLPINIYFSNGISSEQLYKIIMEKDGLAVETIIKIDMHVERQQSRKLNYTKLSKLNKKYGLTFLSKKYFNNIEKKQLIYM